MCCAELRPELVSGECRTAAEYCTALVPAPAQPHLARLQAAKSPAQLPGPGPGLSPGEDNGGYYPASWAVPWWEEAGCNYLK